MTVLLQISDPHFGTERAHLQSALLNLTQEHQPDLLVLSGDITQRATRSQFTAARVFIDSLRIPRVLAIPGNHDIPLYNLAARIFWPYARYRAVFGHTLESEFENDDLLLITLNTTRWYRHIDGELSTHQIERVAARLERAPPSCWRVIVTHQPLAVTRQDDRHDLLHGHQQALTRWSAAGADVVMGGHIHLPYVLPLHARFPERPSGLWAVQAGTALSSRVREEAPNSVNLIRIEAGASQPRRLLVERWDYVDEMNRFECAAVHRLYDDAAE
jgi:3',5'-cyclic AMP phosphodiesterase CpdA